MKTILILPDGREIRSGEAGVTAVQSCALTQCVNAGNELQLGSVCAAMAELRLWVYEDLQLHSGQQIRLLQEENGIRTDMGSFLLEKPTRPTANTLALTAFDPIVKLDKDLTAWLKDRKQWPVPLQDLAREVCEACELELAEGEIPNGEYQVPKFTAEGITGRQLLQWIAQIAGRFVRATVDGKAEFAWYTPAQLAVAPDSRQSRYVSVRNGAVTLALPGATARWDAGDLRVDSALLTAQLREENLILTAEGEMPAVFYYQDGLSYESFETAPISRIVLRRSQEDVGVGYPADTGEENPYVITANPMLSADKAALQQVAQTLFSLLQGVTYTPCRVTVAATNQLVPGQILQLQDRNGRFLTAYIMQKRRSGGQDVLECTGSYRRSSATELHSQSFENLQGRVLNLRKDVDGLFISHEDAQKNLAQLQLSVSGLQAQVQQQSEDTKALTSLEQSAEDLVLRIQRLEGGASQVRTETGYTFDQNGLHIQKSGQEMENTLDHTGMYVRRGNKVLLQANHKGVEAADVTVRNYLIVGDHARFEDYGGGTGCFWI